LFDFDDIKKLYSKKNIVSIQYSDIIIDITAAASVWQYDVTIAITADIAQRAEMKIK
jgi:hypothetical protein